jgi:hypothetical protein
MPLSIFTDQSHPPDIDDLANALGKTFAFWNEVRDFVFTHYPVALEEWNHAGKNFGWGCRLKDKKRVIVYRIPCDGYFKTALVFGQRATDEALVSDIADGIKEEIRSAKVYAEGRGFRIDVRSKAVLKDVLKLVLIKLAH